MRNRFLFFILASSFALVANASQKDDAADAYIMALNSMSPITAKYTLLYKEAVEQKCNTTISVDQLNTNGFSLVVQAIVMSESVDKMGLDTNGNSLQDTLGVIGKNISCIDLSEPLKALLVDTNFNEKHEYLSKILHALDEFAIKKDKVKPAQNTSQKKDNR